MERLPDSLGSQAWKGVAAAFILLAELALQPAQAEDAAALLWTQATVYRDGWGVPHVYADNALALGFAFGYAQAEDHAEAMLFAYRVATGRAAEIAGEAYADSDAFSVKMGHGRLAQAALEHVDPLTRDLCEGFALGVNSWLLEHSSKAPAWAEGVQPSDVLALWHAFLTSLAPFDLPQLWRRPPAMETGNAWALAPEKTSDGKTLLVINPHGYYDGPFRWYEAHLVMQDMNIAGATLFGLPVILQGHNDVLGWALTPNRPDFADVFTERIEGPVRNPRDPRLPDPNAAQAPLLAYMSTAQPYYVRTETGLQQRFVPALITDRGPIFEQGGGLFSWKIGGYRDFGGFLQLVEMARAQNRDMFLEALLLHQLPCFHLTYADREGNIFYLYNAKVGNKPWPEDPLPAEEGEGEGAEGPPPPPEYPDYAAPIGGQYEVVVWGQIIAPSDLPFLSNPDAGFVQACGNPPWFATDDATLYPSDWPGWFVGDGDTFRARRVRQLLRGGGRSFRDMQSMLYDVVAPAAVDLVPKLLLLADGRSAAVESSHPDLAAGLDLLRGWNCTADTASSAMTFFHLWWSMLRAQARQQSIPEYTLYDALLQEDAEAGDAALHAAADAARMLRNEYQRISVPWGEVHRIRRGSRDEALAGSGSGEPIFVASDYAYDDGAWRVTYGYGLAMAVEFGETPQAVSVVPFGASEDPASPHFDDQFTLFRERRFKHTRFTADDVLRHAQRARGRELVFFTPGGEGAATLRAEMPVEGRLTAAAEAPSPLPAGHAVFSMFLATAYAPARTPVETTLEIVVPESLCAPENRTRLAIHVLTPEDGWRRLPAQHLDEDAGVLTGFAAGPGVFAVLGPEDALRTEAGASLAEALSALRAPPVQPSAQIETPAPDPAVDEAERAAAAASLPEGPARVISTALIETWLKAGGPKARRPGGSTQLNNQTIQAWLTAPPTAKPQTERPKEAASPAVQAWRESPAKPAPAAHDASSPAPAESGSVVPAVPAEPVPAPAQPSAPRALNNQAFEEWLRKHGGVAPPPKAPDTPLVLQRRGAAPPLGTTGAAPVE